MSDYQQSYPSSASAPTNTMAVVSLVFSILGVVGACPGLGPIIGLVTGYMAQNEMRTNPGQYSGDGLAKAGIIIGWVGVGFTVLAICAVVAWFLFFGVVISSGQFESSRLLLGLL